MSGQDLAASAAREWSNLVTTAVLGTDRKRMPVPPLGWEALRTGDDPAVELLDRAAAVATARRAGMQPTPAPLPIERAPDDPRPPCSAESAELLAQMLGGLHEILLPEWLARCADAGLRPPAHLVPALLLRGRRHPALDVAARAVIGPRAAWLAEAMPELGVRAVPKPLPAGADPFAPPLPPPDSGAVVGVVVEMFHDRSATWATVAQLRLVVASIEPSWLPALTLELNRAPFHAVTERTRVDLLGIARMRRAMIDGLAQTVSGAPVG